MPSARPWLIRHLADPPRQTRQTAALILALLMLFIGWLDYLTGARVSLELLYLIPITLGVAWLGPWQGVAAAIVSIGLRVGGDLLNAPYPYPYAVAWNRFTDFLVYFVLVWVMYGLIAMYRELDRRVEERTRALQEAGRSRERLERELLDIAARERNAIGHELHDDLCQQLVGTAFAAKVLAEKLADSGAPGAGEAQSIVTYLDEGIAKTRGIARGLLLSSIEPDALADELANLAVKGSESGIPCRFSLEGDPTVQDSAVAAQLFRIAQEAMRNAIRHASAKTVHVVLAGTADSLVLLVRDDGRGLPDPADRGRGMGLQIMAHRAALIGGVLTVVPLPGEGTRVICRINRATSTADERFPVSVA